ncbi:MAG: Hsp20/alpha crystallin family protein [Alistipes senegalensis]|nr:Hsp20/alpha crystallin family protein [Oxalobacter formigenes]MCM1281445.1 Hsp20/alpha crystallin family protein [Alistipes senegalensis]
MTFDPSRLMWVRALKMLEQAERLQSQFFQLRPGRQSGPAWEPPVDIFEIDGGVLILAALPGVAPEHIRIRLDKETLAIVGERPPMTTPPAVIRRMEIPHGRFERHIHLGEHRFEIREKTLSHGCLKLILKKSDKGEP